MKTILSVFSSLRYSFSLLLFLQIFANTEAQVNEWTWTSGDNLPGKFGVYGTKGVQAVVNTPGGRSGAIQWNDNHGDLWMMGGFGLASATTGNLNDLWKFSIQDKQWTWVSGDNIPNQVSVFGAKGVADIGNKPGARNTSTSATDAHGNLWLMGGYSSSGYQNDLWKFDITTGLWTWVGGDNTANKKGVYGTKGTSDAANKPGARYSAASCSDINGDIWLFGGYGYGVSGADFYLNDLWKFNVATGQWTWISGDVTTGQVGIYGTKGTSAALNKPGARYSPAMWTDASGNMWLFGGTGFALTTGAVGGELNDLWKFDILTGEWTWMSGDNTLNQAGNYGTIGAASATNKPGGRHAPAIWQDPTGKTYMFGGSGFAATGGLTSLNDLWELDLPGGEWTWIDGNNTGSQKGIYGVKATSAATNVPGARYDAVSWMDSDRRLWMFGGNGVGSTVATGYLNDMWSYQLPDVILPVEFIYFTATDAGATVQLNWSTAQEINSNYFSIERSYDGNVFETIGRVSAAGQSNSVLNYGFTDRVSGEGTLFYRIKQVDIDNKFMYSKITSIVKNKLSAFDLKLLGNPVKNEIQLKFAVQTSQKLTLLIKNASGNLILRNDRYFEKGSVQYIMRVDKLKAGVYYLTMKGERIEESKIFIKL